MTRLNNWKSSFAIFLFLAASASSAQTFTTLFTFDYKNGTGYGNLVQATDGNFYGVGGGGQYGWGEVYEMTPEGRLRTVYSFCAAGLPCSDGMGPNSLMQAANGNFYGTTSFGGAYGWGDIFELTPGGEFNVLHSFCAGNVCTDGYYPWGFVQGFNGNLYGTTNNGGIYDRGTIFEITRAGQFTTIYNFCAKLGCPDGFGPGALVLAPSGNFYGTTYAGPCTGCGTLFEVSPAGKLRVLYTFLSAGAYPRDPTLGTDGNLYGSTYYTGCCTFGGIVFKITPDGNETTLHTFCSQTNCGDGELPVGAFTQGTDGNYYGATAFGGTNSCPDGLPFQGCGTIFSITPTGTLTTLYDFCPQTNCPDGDSPDAPPILATDGKFYGTVTEGGDLRGNCTSSTSIGCGTIYSLDLGFGAFVKSNPTFGKVGYKINILGNHLTGASGVTFNGAPATFTVVSDTYIRATVPIGAGTGTIQVTTPTGTLVSNVAFQVIR